MDQSRHQDGSLGRIAPFLLLITLAFVGGAHRGEVLRSPPSGFGELFEHTKSETSANVIVLFQMMDCAGARQDLALWNELHRHPQFSVRGVLLDASAEARVNEEVLSGAGFEFEVMLRPPAGTIDFVRSLGFTTTPIILAFDDAGHLRFSASASEFSSSELIASTLAAYSLEE